MGATAIAETLDEILLRCRAGDTEGFAEVYRQLGRGLYGTALRILMRPEDAEDAVQDTFVSFYRSVPDIPGHQLGAWLHRVLINTCIDRLRRRKRRDAGELNEEITPAAPGRQTEALDLRQAVARLPEHARRVFVLHDVEGYKHQEIGRMLGLSTGTSKSQLFRARAALRRLMAGGYRGGRETG